MFSTNALSPRGRISPEVGAAFDCSFWNSRSNGLFRKCAEQLWTQILPSTDGICRDVSRGDQRFTWPLDVTPCGNGSCLKKSHDRPSVKQLAMTPDSKAWGTADAGSQKEKASAAVLSDPFSLRSPSMCAFRSSRPLRSAGLWESLSFCGGQALERMGP
jgi:hypothetical protein